MTRWVYVSVALTVLAFAGSFYVYYGQHDRLPERIAIHWGADGQPNGWVERQNALPYFLIVPGIMVFIVLLTLVLPWLSPKQFEVGRFRTVFDYVMTLIVVLTAYLHFLTLLAGVRRPEEPLSPNFFVVAMLLFFVLIGNVMGRVKRNFWMGVRTPWTLASETVWDRTHRVTAWLWVGYGLIGFVAVLLGLPPMWCVAGLLVVALAPVVYSLVLYKRLEKAGKL